MQVSQTKRNKKLAQKLLKKFNRCLGDGRVHKNRPIIGRVPAASYKEEHLVDTSTVYSKQTVSCDHCVIFYPYTYEKSTVENTRMPYLIICVERLPTTAVGRYAQADCEEGQGSQVPARF